MSFIFSFIRDVILKMLHLIWFGKKTISNSLKVYIKTNTGQTLAVDLNPKWDIADVKKIVGSEIGLSPEQIKIILAGKELHNSTVIEECDLGQQSILHAVGNVRRIHKIETDTTIRESFSESEADVSGSKPLNETLTDLSLDDSREEESKNEGHRAHFYVYCSHPCKSVKPGKLRVRCATCGSGAVTVDRDPQCWPDVLLPNRITVHCENPLCPTLTYYTEDLQVNYARFYFKCTSHTSLGETDEAVPLNLIKHNFDEIPCIACTDVKDTIVVFPCKDEHDTCLECFCNYCSVQLRERQFVFDEKTGYYTLLCPAGCENSFISEVHHFRLLTPLQYDRYQRFAAEEYVLKVGGFLCPQPDCGMGIILDKVNCQSTDDNDRRITCIGGCGYVFCKNCLQGFHLGECESPITSSSTSNLNTFTAFTKNTKSDDATKRTIKTLTKPCPKCRTPTERDGGCMHMVCTRAGCKYQWCWVCQTEWTRNCMGNHWFG